MSTIRDRGGARQRDGQVGVVVCAAGPADLRLGNRPLLLWAVEAMEANRSVAALVVAAPRRALDATAKLLADHGAAKLTAVVPAGRTRLASVAAGLAALPPGLGYVAVHDAARPLAEHGLVDRLLEALQAMDGTPACAGVVPAVPVTDTVRRVGGDGRSGGVVDRALLRAVQTPQLFQRAALEAAHRHALQHGLEAGDDAALAAHAGHPVAVVPGSVENLKVTTPLDLLVAEAMLEQRLRKGGA